VSQVSREITGTDRTIRDLLAGNHFSIDYYQREYKWETKQVLELLNDLATKFLGDYEESHSRREVARYGHYFLGSVIVSHKEGKRFLIDGQQRVTTLTLLLILIHNLQKDREDKVEIQNLILSTSYGEREFNLQVEERDPAMQALFAGEEFEASDCPESVTNLLGRFSDLEENFPEQLKERALPYFTDWLVQNVHIVEIVTYSDDDAYTIFETMNDRGLSLTATDMLRGYLLASITEAKERKQAGEVWKKRMLELQELGKESDADAIKAWLRSQHAESIRERKKDSLNQDFELIGSGFHRWVREKRDRLGLDMPGNCARFVLRDFNFYTKWFIRIRGAEMAYSAELPSVYRAACLSFTLQHTILLAPLVPEDPEEVCLKKLQIVGAYIETWLARRIWNSRQVGYSSLIYAAYLVIREIRGKPVEELARILKTRLDKDEDTFAKNERFRLHGQNRRYVHWLLACFTSQLESASGAADPFQSFFDTGKSKFEVEHIWANHFERHQDEFSHQADFEEHRNRIGGLLLLPKKFNASYGDMPYAEKREHYNTRNLLARSLHDLAYERNPGFLQFIRDTGLPFQPHPEFKAADLEARSQLYRQLAEKIWSPGRLLELAELEDDSQEEVGEAQEDGSGQMGLDF
jgi:uncharacterized protein with ParB-like and HNH nuclease domain